MTYGIICAMDEEIAILKANLKNEATTKIGPIEFLRVKLLIQMLFWLNLELVKSKQELRLL